MKTMQSFAKEFGIKQWVCELPLRPDGSSFRVFTTGNPEYYIFALLDPKGYDFSMHIPAKKSDLKPEVAKYISRQFYRR